MTLSFPFVQYFHWIWPLGLTAVFLPLWGKFIEKQTIVAVLDFRRKGKSGIPLMGGVPIAVAYFIGAFTVGGPVAELIAASSIPLLLISGLDDVHQISPRTKFLGQMLTVGIFLAFAPADLLLFSRIGIPSPLAQVFAGFWILGMINAVNMIDGMDGEAAGFAVLAGMALYCMFHGHSYAPSLAILSSASAGFLIYNFAPAQIYLGDVGSAFLGFALAASAVCLPAEHPDWSVGFVPLLLFAFAEVDAVRAMWRRWRSSTPMTQGDHQHLHHKLLKIDFSVRGAWTVIMATNLVSALAAIGIFFSHEMLTQILLLGITIAGLSAQMMWLDYTHALATKRFSNLSSSLLARFLKLKPDPWVQGEPHHLTMYDLIPYYKELQQRGIINVTAFFEDFGRYVAAQHANALHISMLGQASIVVIEPGEAEAELQSRLVQRYFALIDKHHLRLNEAKKPWGLEMPRPDSRLAKSIYKLLQQKTNNVEELPLRKVS